MKTNSKSNLVIALSLLAAPFAFGQTTPAPAQVRADVAEMKADSKEAALELLNREIDRLDDRVDDAPNAEEKAALKTRIAALKERRSELRKEYVQARYDSLKADVSAEYGRISTWTKRTFTSDSSSSSMSDANDIAYYKSRPTDTSKAEAKAGLAAVKKEIGRLEDQCQKMPKGEQRKAAEMRIKALEKRRDQIEDNFNKAYFDTLIDDVKAEWKSHNHS